MFSKLMVLSPVFVCDLSPNIDYIFGLDAGKENSFILNFGTGVLWLDGGPDNDALHDCVLTW